jgi:hypothetical protein
MKDRLVYGMLIDADLNNATGFLESDYQVELMWEKKIHGIELFQNCQLMEISA